MKVIYHSLTGSVLTCSVITLLQAIASRKLKRLYHPTSLAIAISTFVGLFRLIHRKKQENKTQAAALASLAALVLLKPSHRDLVVSYAALGTIESLLKKQSKLSEIENIEIPLGGLGFSLVLYIWLNLSHLYHPDRVKSLDKLSPLRQETCERMRLAFETNKIPSRCKIFHPEHSMCVTFHQEILCRGIRQSSKFYLPLYLFSAGILKYKAWLYGPRPNILRILRQYMGSCMYLPLVYQIPLTVSCLAYKCDKHRIVTIFAGFTAALSLLFEEKQRRASIVRATLVYALGPISYQLAKQLKVPEPMIHSGQIALGCAAITYLFQQPSLERESKVVKWLYGEIPNKQIVQETKVE